MTQFLTADDVVDIHDDEDPSPLRDRGALEAAVARPMQSLGGEDAYPTVHDKAAAMWQSLDHNQPFSDGNKRTAVLCTRFFYALNGLVLTWSDADIYDIAMSVAEGVLDVTMLAERLKVFAVEVPPLPSASDDESSEMITMPGAAAEAPVGGH